MREQDYFGAPAHLRKSQAPCDSVESHFAGDAPRTLVRRDPPPLDPALVPSDDELQLRLADELEYARRMIEKMGDELGDDMSVVMRHSVALQTIDIVGQMLGHIAAVTRSAAPERAVDRIGMCELKMRLKRPTL